MPGIFAGRVFPKEARNRFNGRKAGEPTPWYRRGKRYGPVQTYIC